MAHGNPGEFCFDHLERESAEVRDAAPALEALYTTRSRLDALLREGEVFDHHVSTSLRIWERGIRQTLGHGFVYRGMAVSSEHLISISKEGLIVAKTGYAGNFFSTEPAEAFGYAYKRLVQPGLAVVLALDYDTPAIVGRGTMTNDDIPPEAIAAILIFDTRSARALPFEVYRRPPRSSPETVFAESSSRCRNGSD